MGNYHRLLEAIADLVASGADAPLNPEAEAMKLSTLYPQSGLTIDQIEAMITAACAMTYRDPRRDDRVA